MWIYLPKAVWVSDLDPLSFVRPISPVDSVSLGGFRSFFVLVVSFFVINLHKGKKQKSFCVDVLIDVPLKPFSLLVFNLQSPCVAGLGRCLQEQPWSHWGGPHLRGTEEERHRVPNGRSGCIVPHPHTTEGKERNTSANIHVCMWAIIHTVTSSLRVHQRWTRPCSSTWPLHHPRPYLLNLQKPLAQSHKSPRCPAPSQQPLNRWAALTPTF